MIVMVTVGVIFRRVEFSHCHKRFFFYFSRELSLPLIMSEVVAWSGYKFDQWLHETSDATIYTPMNVDCSRICLGAIFVCLQHLPCGWYILFMPKPYMSNRKRLIGRYLEEIRFCLHSPSVSRSVSQTVRHLFVRQIASIFTKFHVSRPIGLRRNC